MERFCGAVEDSADPKMLAVHIDIYSLFLDVLQEELAPYAADLAYALFSANEIARQRRCRPRK